MGVQTVSTRTLKGDVTTKVFVHTNTIISEVESEISNSDDRGVVEGVTKTLKDYWFPSSTDSENDDSEEGENEQEHSDPSHFQPNSVMRRAYDYWKSLTQDSEETAKELVNKAKLTRDGAAKEAKWAMMGYKPEARHAYEAAEQKYRDALAAAEKVHEEALRKARSSWFHQTDVTQEESLGEQATEITHEKWDQFKAAVDSLMFSPPKYTCSPSSQYWFSRQNPAADSGWDSREIWDHHSHNNNALKTLPKKHLPMKKVHSILEGLFHQAGLKSKTSPSSTSFDSTLKTVKDYYHGVLDRIARNEQGAVEELESLTENVKTKLNEAKYHEEQIDAWLMAQWNAVVDNAGEVKDQYKRAFRNASIHNARSNVKDTIKGVKDDIVKSKVNKVIHDATETFSNTLKEAEAKIKAAPKNAYDSAIETFNKETAHLKSKLEQLAEAAKKSGSSLSHEASKTVSSVAAKASHSGKILQKDANRKLNEVKQSAESIKSKASSEYERATVSVSSMWGAATPFAKAQGSYHQLLDDATNNLFGDKTSSVQQELSSFYGALTAPYLLVLARQIWLRRKCHLASSEVYGGLHLTKQKRRHSHSHSHSHGSESSDDQHHHHHHHGHHEKHRRHSRHEHTKIDEIEIAGRQKHHGNSFGAVLKSFTSVAPMTMVLLVFLDLAGFSRVALHTLFVGLVTSQFLKYGCFNSALQQLGILDGALGEVKTKHPAREMGNYLGWTVFGLAGAANAKIKFCTISEK
ncbi:hypothetical protein BGX26_010445 [Mortierella sp. AD094]|nr:hypothetical protein BGX26_010445 [Mortierella sp. AD094]